MNFIYKGTKPNDTRADHALARKFATMIRESAIRVDREMWSTFCGEKLGLYIFEIECFSLYKKTLNAFHHSLYKIRPHVGMERQRDDLLYHAVRH